MKNRIIQEILKGILEVAVTVESPTKKDREKYMKKAQVGSGRLNKKIPVVNRKDSDSKLIFQ